MQEKITLVGFLVETLNMVLAIPCLLFYSYDILHLISC